MNDSLIEISKETETKLRKKLVKKLSKHKEKIVDKVKSIGIERDLIITFRKFEEIKKIWGDDLIIKKEDEENNGGIGSNSENERKRNQGYDEYYSNRN